MGGMTGCLALADGAGPDTEWVGRAALRIAHRGPDDEGFFADPDVALAFKRLAVIDPSAGGRQPMYSADGRYVMVFDGEIYNYIELAQRLAGRGVQLRTRSGAEVLIETHADVCARRKLDSHGRARSRFGLCGLRIGPLLRTGSSMTCRSTRRRARRSCSIRRFGSIRLRSARLSIRLLSIRFAAAERQHGS